MPSSLFDLGEGIASQPILNYLCLVTDASANVFDLPSRRHIHAFGTQLGNVSLDRGAARTQQTCQVFLRQQRTLRLSLLGAVPGATGPLTTAMLGADPDSSPVCHCLPLGPAMQGRRDEHCCREAVAHCQWLSCTLRNALRLGGLSQRPTKRGIELRMISRSGENTDE